MFASSIRNVPLNCIFLSATLYSASSASLDDVIWSSLKQADSMDFEIRQMVIYTIPKLATAFSSYFKSHNEVIDLNCSHYAQFISLGFSFQVILCL